MMTQAVEGRCFVALFCAGNVEVFCGGSKIRRCFILGRVMRAGQVTKVMSERQMTQVVMVVVEKRQHRDEESLCVEGVVCFAETWLDVAEETKTGKQHKAKGG